MFGFNNSYFNSQFMLNFQYMKNITVPFILALFLLASCGKESEGGKASGNQTQTVTFGELYSNTYENPGVNIAVEGLVVHVCKHSGKKIFIVGTDPANRFQILAGDKMSGFPMDLEGSRVRVVGLLEEEKIDAKYLAEWESEISSNEKDESKKTGRSCAFEDERKEVLDLRTRIARSPKGYFSLFSMKAVAYDKL